MVWGTLGDERTHHAGRVMTGFHPNQHPWTTARLSLQLKHTNIRPSVLHCYRSSHFLAASCRRLTAPHPSPLLASPTHSISHRRVPVLWSCGVCSGRVPACRFLRVYARLDRQLRAAWATDRGHVYSCREAADAERSRYFLKSWSTTPGDTVWRSLAYIAAHCHASSPLLIKWWDDDMS